VAVAQIVPFTFVQAPRCPATLHACPASQLGTPQQTASTQKPDTHASLPVQGVPTAPLGVQMPLAQ
jgi:hypothetical protein